MAKNEDKRKFHYGFLIVVCCCIFSATSVAFAFGCSGIFYTPVSEALGVSRGTFAISATLLALTSGFGVKIINPLVEKYGLRKMVIAMLGLQAGCFIAQAYFTKVWMFYITGALIGFVQALMPVIVSTVAINNWFKSNAGFFIGFSSSTTGISGIVINPIAGKFMEAYGWEATYILYGAIILLTAIPLAIFVFREHPSQKGLEPYEGKVKEKPESKKASVPKDDPDVGVRYDVAIRSKAFVLTLITIMCVNATANFVPFIPSFASSIGMTISFAATLAGVGQIGTLVGKNVIGVIADRNPVLMVTLATAVPCSGLIIMLFFGQYSTALMWLGSALFGTIYASSTVGDPLVVMKVFGMRDFMKIYGTICMFIAVTGAITSALWGYIADIFNGSFTVSMLCCIACCITGCITGNLAFRESKKLVREARESTM